ncbi:CHAT domain-containing tetratricopeptide repeat protein [Dokdonella koreensis]|nr:CHAT domain-containing tetratricopeptide repeat protein [Dokdonella koreensis]
MRRWIRHGIIGLALCTGGIAVPAAEPVDAVERALRAEDYALADRLTRERIAAAEREHDAASPSLLQAIDQRVDLLLESDRQDLPETAALIRRERELAQALAGAASRESARALLREARWQLQRRDFAAFRTAVAAAVAIGERVLAADDADRAEIDVLAGIGEYYFLGKPRDGEARTRHALGVLRAHRPERQRALAAALRSDGRIKLDDQKLAEAVAALQAYETYARSHFGADSARRSDALTWLGYALRESGRYAEGIEALEHGVRIAADLRPYRQRLHVDALIALGQNLGMVGDVGRAQAAFEAAVAIEEKQPTSGGYLLALALKSLGSLHGNAGDAARAATYHARVLPIFERLFGADSPQARATRLNHAEALQGNGQLDQAAAIYENLIAAYEAAPDAAFGSVPLTPYEKLATLRLWQRRYGEAQTLYGRFLERLGDGRDFEEINSRRGLAGRAAAHWGQGRHAQALADLGRAHASSMRVRRAALGQLSERQMLALDGSEQDLAALAVAIAADSGDPALTAQAWTWVLEAGGIVTQAAALRIAAAAAARTPAGLAPWQAWRSANEALSAARVAATRSPSAAAISAVDQAQDRVDASERRIAALDLPASAALSAGHGDLAAALDALPDGAVLVHFVESPAASADRYLRDPVDGAQLYALVGRRGRPLHAIDLGPVRAVAEQVGHWYALASRRGTDDRQTEAAGQALYRSLLAPLDGAAQDRRFYIVPSPVLHRVAFAALVGADGRYLAEAGWRFHLFNHEREALLPAPGAGGRLLLAGAAQARAGAPLPAPRLRKACPGLDADAFAVLPGASSEITALREVAAGHVGAIDVLAGAAATEAAVRGALPGHAIVHLATHAFAFGDRCLDGAGLRAIALDRPSDQDRTIDPAGLSGLSALAFLPAAGDRNGLDGLLTSEEIATLDLSAADWVVLSACETALGRVRGDEGVFGLRRAFRLAGARTVVMSLWKVEDTATAEFMHALYTARLVDRRDTPAAVQAAMQATLAARRARGASTHPLYWAGFVAAGAWR